jgi:hypothetical protein
MMLGDDTIRLYVAMCDQDTVGRIGYVDVDARDPRRVVAVSAEPVLDIGQPGCFDDNGVLPLCIIRRETGHWLYYNGYQLTPKARYLMFTGLAMSTDGGASFRRHSRVPVLDRTDAEPLVRTAAFVMATENGFRMWYVGGDRQELVGDRMRPVYDLRHAVSVDGVHWPDHGDVVIPLTEAHTHGYGRPFVVKQGEEYRMWYSIRRRDVGYRLGYAVSSDGLAWSRRDDEAGIDISASGWDSQSVSYSAFVPTPFGSYLFYNGNDYGRTGFGVAVLETG